jgi:hypothetical protein
MKRLVIILFSLLSCLSASEGFVLFTSLYEERNIQRQEEFLQCIEKNLKNSYLKKILIFFERKNTKPVFEEKIKIIASANEKLNLVYINSRPTFQYYFQFANDFFPLEKIIVSNGDIFFDTTLSFLDEKALDNSLICLTRYDSIRSEEFELHDKDLIFSPCQDSWIFQSPIKNFFCDIQLGILGCDPSIAYYAYCAGLKVYNPCKSIITYHLHQSNIRTYHNLNQYEGQHPFVELKLCDLEYGKKNFRKKLIRKI